MGAQISQQTDTTVTVHKTLVRQHIQEVQSLKSELVIKSEEIQFLRRRIIDDFTEYISQLEEELRKEKSKLLEKTKVIDKYASLCKKLDDKLRVKILDNESLIGENNRLVLELINIKTNPYNFGNFEKPQAPEVKEDEQEEPQQETFDLSSNSSIVELVKVHEHLDELKDNVDVLKKKLLSEGPHQKVKPEEKRFSHQVYEYNQRKEVLHSQGIVNFAHAKPKYKPQLSRNDEKRIDAIGKVYQLEVELQNCSTRLDDDISEVVAKIRRRLRGYERIIRDENALLSDSQQKHELKGADQTDAGKPGDDKITKSDSYLQLEDYFADNMDEDDSKVQSKNLSRTISEESEA
ncbi:hypothetical protein Trydic_g4753 [Trypoxylus dichotomus]